MAAARSPLHVTGHLELVCAMNGDRRSYLRTQSFQAPFHISKPFMEEETLVVNVVNPTAGFFSGDNVTCKIRVENDARLLLTSPGAHRVHCTKEGRAAMEQEFRIMRNGFLEVLPELFIPQAGAHYSQRTRIDVEPGGTLMFFEMLAPGRVASGETFAFSRLDWTTEIFLDGNAIAIERYSLQPNDDSLAALRTEFPYYATCFAIGDRFSGAEGCRQEIHASHSDAVWIGCTRLVEGGFVVKLLARDSVVLRSTIRRVRELLYEALQRSAPCLRRV